MERQSPARSSIRTISISRFTTPQGNYHSIALEKGVKVQVEDKLVFHRQMLDQYTNTQMHDLTAYLVTLK